MMLPTVGRVVHFYGTLHEEPSAAMITRVSRDGIRVVVDMTVLPAGQAPYCESDVTYSEERVPRKHWCWPPRV